MDEGAFEMQRVRYHVPAAFGQAKTFYHQIFAGGCIRNEGNLFWICVDQRGEFGFEIDGGGTWLVGLRAREDPLARTFRCRGGHGMDIRAIDIGEIVAELEVFFSRKGS